MEINQTTEVVEIYWHTLHSRKYLKFSFIGDLTESAAEEAILKWKMEFSKVNSGEKVDLIWDCLEMKKYSAKSAKIWKNAMSDLNDKTDRIWLITNNTFIKMGAKTVTFLLPIDLKVIGSEVEIRG